MFPGEILYARVIMTARTTMIIIMITVITIMIMIMIVAREAC